MLARDEELGLAPEPEGELVDLAQLTDLFEEAIPFNKLLGFKHDVLARGRIVARFAYRPGLSVIRRAQPCTAECWQRLPMSSLARLCSQCCAMLIAVQPLTYESTTCVQDSSIKTSFANLKWFVETNKLWLPPRGSIKIQVRISPCQKPSL